MSFSEVEVSMSSDEEVSYVIRCGGELCHSQKWRCVMSFSEVEVSYVILRIEGEFVILRSGGELCHSQMWR